MPTDLAPDRVSPKYPPTATAEAFARYLAETLTAIADRFASLMPEALAALADGDTVPAEQLCSDEEHISDAVTAVVNRYVTNRQDNMLASDSITPFLANLLGTMELCAVLDEQSPERQARQLAWTLERGFDPLDDY